MFILILDSVEDFHTVEVRRLHRIFGGLEFDSMEHFKQELIAYLDYYNNHRIKAKLKGLPPVLHRQQALSVA